MGWDESAFGWLYKKISSTFQNTNLNTTKIGLDEIKNSLEHFASFCCGSPINIVNVSDAGGFDGHTLYLPKRIDVLLNNEDIYATYLFKVLYLTHPLALKSSKKDVLKALEEQYPSFFELKIKVVPLWMKIYSQSIEDVFLNHVSSDFLFGKLWGSAEIHSAVDLAKYENIGKTEKQDEQKKSELLVNRSSKTKTVDLRKEENENPFTHSFEKVHTLDQYTGGMKTQDGSDEIAEHSEALSELQMDTMAISSETAESLLKTQTVGGGTWDEKYNPELHHQSKEYWYPEWDFKKRVYRPNWCRIIETIEVESEEAVDFDSEEKKESQKLYEYLASLKNARAWKNRQLDGDDLDIDASQNAIIDARAGTTPSERIYRRKPSTFSEWSVLILIDQSLSTESWLGDEQIIKLEKKIIRVLGESLDKVGICWALASFSSNTRKDVSFNWIKNFTESWTSKKKQLEVLRPKGATRLGPILRHASTYLLKRPEKKKMLLFISDTKPTDFDYYEGEYGASDFVKAIREARQNEIFLHVAALHDGSYKSLNRFFRIEEYSVVKSLNDIHKSLQSWLKVLLK